MTLSGNYSSGTVCCGNARQKETKELCTEICAMKLEKEEEMLRSLGWHTLGSTVWALVRGGIIVCDRMCH